VQPEDVLRSPEFPELPEDSIGTSIFKSACFSTRPGDPRPWWRADLIKRVIFSAVRITLPKEALGKWDVLIGEKPDLRSMRLLNRTISGGKGSVRSTLDSNGIIGRYVAIVETLPQKKPVRICNVEIFGSFVGN